MNYQIHLTDSSGTAVADGTKAVKLTIYNQASGGTQLYTACSSDGTATGTPTAVTATFTNGTSSILVGSSLTCATGSPVAIPETLFNNATMYLGVTVESDAEMTPRKRIVSAGYAMNADRLDDLETSAAGGTSAFVPVTDTTGLFTLTGTPSTVAGVITVNPASPAANALLVDFKSDDTSRFSVDAEGDIAATGAISGLTGLSLASGNFLQSGTGTFTTGTGLLTAGGGLLVSGNATIAGTVIALADGTAINTASGALSIGNSGTTALNLSRLGQLTTVGGDLAVTGNATVAGDLDTSAATFNLASGATTLNLAGGSGSTGCTIDASGNLTCSGSVGGAGSGANTALSNLASVAINTSLVSDAADTDDLGSTAAEWRSAYLGDAGRLYFGLAQDADIRRSAANTLTLTASAGVATSADLTAGGSLTVNGTALTLAGNDTVIDMTGTGTLSLNTVTNRAITTGTGPLTAGGDLLVTGNATVAGDFDTSAATFNLASGATTLNLAGGSGSTGCTIDGSGNLECSGTISGTGAETDTLDTVVVRGATTTTLVNLDGGIAVDTDNFTVNGTTGYVGIGTASPGYGLVLYENILSVSTPGTGGTDQTSFLLFSKDADGDGYNDSGDKLWQFGVRGDAWSGVAPAAGSYFLSYYNGSTWANQFTIETSGEVGIGTTAPSGTLHVSGGQAKLPNGSVVAGNSPGIAFDSYADTGLAANADNLAFYESGTIALVLSNTTKEFRVPSDYKFSWSSATNNNSTSDTSLYRSSAGVIRTDDDLLVYGSISGLTGLAMASGNFTQTGTGTFSTGTGLATVGGDLAVTGNATVAGDLDTSAATFNLASGATTLNLAGGSGSTGCTIDASGNLTCSGSVGGAGSGANTALSNLASVAINTSLVSDAADTDDLGSTAAEWRSAYLGDAGRLYFGLAQDADIRRSAANTLTLTASAGVATSADLTAGGSLTVNGTALTLAGNDTVIDMTGTGTLSLNTVTNRAITTGTGPLTAGGDLLVTGNATVAGDFDTSAATFNLASGATTLNLAGGSGSTGCTIDGSGNLTCSGSVSGGAGAFVQDGNSFTANAVLGTNDAYSLALETGGTTRLTVGASGGVTLAADNGLALSSGTGTYVQNYTGTGDAMTVDSTSVAGNALNVSANSLTSGSVALFGSTSTDCADCNILETTFSGMASAVTGIYNSVTNSAATGSPVSTTGYFGTASRSANLTSGNAAITGMSVVATDSRNNSGGGWIVVTGGSFTGTGGAQTTSIAPSVYGLTGTVSNTDNVIADSIHVGVKAGADVTYDGTGLASLTALEANVSSKEWDGISKGLDVNNYSTSATTNYANAEKYGIDVLSSGGVTVGNDYGIRVRNVGSNTTVAANKYGIHVASTGSYTGGAGATNNYGLYVSSVTGADNNYGVYVLDTDATSYFGGNVTLNADLAVNGGDLTTSAATFNLAASADTINIGGGYASTGCSVNSSGNLTCSGSVGIGEASPDDKLDIVHSGTTTRGVHVVASSLTSGDGVYVQSAPTALLGGSGVHVGISGVIAGNSETSTAFFGSIVDTGTNASRIAGLRLAVGKVGATSSNTNVYGVYSIVDNSGAHTGGTHSTYGGYFEASGTTAATSNVYGIYIASTTGGGDTNYGLYSATSEKSYFAGSVGLGYDDPGARLHVRATSNVSTTPIGIIESLGSHTPLEFRSTTTPTARFRATSSGQLIIASLGNHLYLRSGDDTTTDLFIDSSSANVGLGDVDPSEAKLVVGNGGTGDIYATFATAGTERLCWDGTGASLITDCTGTPGDYAEQYGTSDSSMEAGDIVVPDGSRAASEYVSEDGFVGSRAWVLKSARPYQAQLLGVVSTAPNETIGTNHKPEENPRPVSLNGRVPVKVNGENGPIAIGDPITSSSVPGVGMRATGPGQIVGHALSEFDGYGQGTIFVFVMPGWHSGGAIAADGNFSVFTSDFAFDRASDAFADEPAKPSRSLTFRGSRWNADVGAAETVGITLANSFKESGDYGLSVVGTLGEEVAYFGSSGDVAVRGSLTLGRDSALASLTYDAADTYSGDRILTSASGFGARGTGFAELMPSDDNLEEGELVMVDTTKAGQVRRAVVDEANPAFLVMGVTAKKPAFLAGPADVGRFPITVSGRAKVKVTTAAKGAVHIGDPITVSETAGVGERTEDPAYIIGVALESYDAAEPGIITIYVRPGWYNGKTVVATEASSSGELLTTITAPVDFKAQPLIGIGAMEGIDGLWSMDGEGRLVVKEVRAEKVVAKDLTVEADDEKQTIGEAVIYYGNSSATVMNPMVRPNSRIFVTFFANVEGSWWVSERTDGSFTLTTSKVAPADLPFEYLIVNVEDNRTPVEPADPPPVDPATVSGDEGAGDEPASDPPPVDPATTAGE